LTDLPCSNKCAVSFKKSSLWLSLGPAIRGIRIISNSEKLEQSLSAKDAATISLDGEDEEILEIGDRCITLINEYFGISAKVAREARSSLIKVFIVVKFCLGTCSTISGLKEVKHPSIKERFDISPPN
jgi:hypothetical protein